MAQTAEVLVIGGGMVGAAVGLGLVRKGAKVLIVDEDDNALRTARGNFGLVWTQTKGLGLQRYQEWTRESAALYSDFAGLLTEETSLSLGHQQLGGLTICTTEEEISQSETLIEQMKAQAGNLPYEAEMIDRQSIQSLIPGIRFGDSVQAAAYSKHDGHVNPLKLLRAMLKSYQLHGGKYQINSKVTDIKPTSAGNYEIQVADKTTIHAEKVVIACGHGIPALAEKCGMKCPTRPQRGQVLVTERLDQILPLPMGSIRQTDEGSILLGVSHEEVGFNDKNSADVAGNIAARAIRILPDLEKVNIVRAWGALRIMPPDGCPIYDESEKYPGVFMVTNHSGVTLAAVHSMRLPEWILDRRMAIGFEEFSSLRFEKTDYASTPH